MLHSVLDADRYPWVQVHVTRLPGEPAVLGADITLHGVARTLRVPITLAVEGSELTVKGQLHFRHTDFAMTPYTTLGGALAVQDDLDLAFRLRALRLVPENTGVRVAETLCR
jgi:polyisoprenoid-binding protein YceI